MSASQPRLDHVSCLDPTGLHRMAYWEWGDPDNPDVLLCVHGLTRTGRDFDLLARRLSDRYRVVCPDVAGRGASEWLRQPAHYVVPQYVGDMMTLVARLRPQTLHWFGTSMGGLIGIVAASLAGSPVSRLVLNDVGPRLEPDAIARIGTYVGSPISFDTHDAALEHVRRVSQSFGPHDDAQWQEFARHTLVQRDGRWVFHYDPRIGDAFRAGTPEMLAAGELALWAAYDAITCPTLVVRGAQSDLISAATAEEMTRRGPRARVISFDGVGHAPTFLHDAQIDAVMPFLREDG